MATGRHIPKMTPEKVNELRAALAQPQTGKGRAWQSVAEAAVARLGPGWTLTGERMETSLVRTPVRWWYEAISFNPASTDGELWFEHQPLLEPIQRRRLGFYGGLSQQSYPRPFQRRLDSYRTDSPRSLPVFDRAAAVETILWWVNGPVEELRVYKTDKEWADTAERRYAPQYRFNRPITWTALPGWRVLLDTGSPLEPLDTILTEGLAPTDKSVAERDFWREFHTLAADNATRTSMLEFLDGKRRQNLADICLLPESTIADVLTAD